MSFLGIVKDWPTLIGSGFLLPSPNSREGNPGEREGFPDRWEKIPGDLRKFPAI